MLIDSPYVKPAHMKKGSTRDDYVKRIEELLTEHKSMTRGQLISELGIRDSRRLGRYMEYMRDELGMIRMSGEYLHSAPLWELGKDLGWRKKLNRPVRDMDKRQVMVPAQQVGMQRDSLVAALFGQA